MTKPLKHTCGNCGQRYTLTKDSKGDIVCISCGKYVEKLKAFLTPKTKMAFKKKTGGKKPDYRATTVVHNEEKDEDYYTNIGVAFEGEKCISILLNALPINDKILLFPYEEKEKE